MLSSFRVNDFTTFRILLCFLGNFPGDFGTVQVLTVLVAWDDPLCPRSRKYSLHGGGGNSLVRPPWKVYDQSASTNVTDGDSSRMPTRTEKSYRFGKPSGRLGHEDSSTIPYFLQRSPPKAIRSSLQVEFPSYRFVQDSRRRAVEIRDNDTV